MNSKLQYNTGEVPLQNALKASRTAGSQSSGAKGSEGLSPVNNLSAGNGTAGPKVLNLQRDVIKTVLSQLRAAIRMRVTETIPAQRLVSVYKGLRAWLDIYHVYGFDFTLHPMERMLRPLVKSLDYAIHWVEHGSTWVQFFKYKNAAFYSFWMHQELPPCPDLPPLQNEVGTWLGGDAHPGVLFGGVFHQFVRRLARSQALSDSFALSILMSKKGMPRATDEMVKEAEDKNVKVMSSIKEQSGNFLYYPPPIIAFGDLELERQPIEVTPSFLQGHIRRTVQDICKRGRKFDLSVLTNPVLPSLSSNYNNTCRKYGTFGLFDQNFPLEVPDLEIGPKGVTAKGWSSQYFGLRRVLDEIGYEDYEREVIGARVNYSVFDHAYKRWYWKLYREALVERPLVKVVGLKEALKIRCISKGPPLHYFVLKPIQKFMWSNLQNFWNFELTGTPITEKLMNTRFCRPQHESRFHSGDYSAATDELHSWASETALDEFIKIWERQSGVNLSSLHQLMEEALTKHVYDHNGQEFPQKRGQLMGSIISFIFLCVANISLLRASYELSHDCYVKLDDLPCWVNGDDCLTNYTSPSFPTVWEALGKMMGLEKSVGKTYDSTSLASINSRFFRLRSDGFWANINFVNLGLIYGVKRSEVIGEQETGVYDLSANYKDLIGGIGEESRYTSEAEQLLREPVTSLFIYKNRNLLKTFKGPWHLPVYLCGLGIPHREATYTERQACTVLANLYGQGVKPPSRVLDSKFKLERRVRSLVEEYSPLTTDTFMKEYENDEDYGRVYVALAYRTWHCHGLKGLLAAGRDSKHAMWRTERLWAKARKLAIEESVRPCQDSLLKGQTVETIYPLVIN